MNTVLSIDLGFGNIKLWDKYGATVMASHAAVPTGSRFSDTLGDGNSKRAVLIESGDLRYYVGEYASHEGIGVDNLGLERLLRGAEIRALLYGAMTRHSATYKKFIAPIVAQVGLPASLLRDDNELYTKAQIRDWMVGKHRWLADGNIYEVEIVEAEITSQAAGAVLDYGLTLDGKVNPDTASSMKKAIGVVSVGFNTIELMVVQNMRANGSLMSSEPYGVRRLLQIIAKNSGQQLASLDMQMREGSLNGELETAIKPWSEMVTANISNVWGNLWTGFGKVIIVGGGAMILRDELYEFFDGRSYTPDKPIESIARGLYKRGVGVSGRAKKV